MEQVNFNYSLKNIPIPSNKDYLLELINSVGIFVSNLRWRSFFFLNPTELNEKETFGLKTSNSAPPVAELKEFEDEMFKLVKSVKFKHEQKTTFQCTLSDNIKDMKKDERIYVAADKTTNFYKMKAEKYEELKNKNITKEYKKASKNEVKKVDLGDRDLAQKLDIDDRVYSLNIQDCFVTIKDHKDNFENNTKCRLLNPSKSDLGKISKKILAKLVKVVREQTLYNHWGNSTSVITWFKL